jgi:hypothetical protein
MSTYSELVQQVSDMLENTETMFMANMPNFFSVAELEIYNSVNIPTLRKNVMGTMTTGNKYISCPFDFLSVYSLAVVDALGTYTYLLNKDVSFMREAYPTPSVTGLPKFYALFGPSITDLNELTLITAPAPDADYAIELHYNYNPESITVAATGHSWLGDNFSNVLLYGAIRVANLFMKAEADMVGYYEQKYTEAMTQFIRLCAGLERGDAYREGQKKIPFNQL